jgi:hypothetical protein
MGAAINVGGEKRLICGAAGADATMMEWIVSTQNCVLSRTVKMLCA